MFSWSYSTKTIINNGILNASKASPMKDNDADGGNSFSMDRRLFIRTNTPIISKKWYGTTSKDASSVTNSRRISEMGSSLNPSKQDFAFKTTRDINVTRNALKRTRSGGCSVPAKKIHKYANAPIFY